MRRRTRGAVVAAGISAVLCASTARRADAQPGGAVVTQPVDQPAPPPPPPQPVIALPEVVKDPGASYPKQAHDDKVKDPVTVVLTLVVGADGSVQNATVDEPQGHGFDEAAIEASKKLELKPATRDGKPIAAKIKHKYTFTPPTSQFVGKIVSAKGDSPLAGATVTVVGAGEGAASYSGTAAADGTFKIEGVPAGKYQVTIAKEGFVPQTYDEEIDAGQEAALEIRLTKEGAVVLPPPPPPAPGEGEVQEVEVKGVRPPREVTKRTLEQRELARIPGTNGDALRGIQNMPGVARAPGLAGILIVRGASPQETNVYVDGTLIPLVYHFGGLTSVIPTEMLDKIDFYPGNFSSYYGRVTGAIVDVGVHDPVVSKTDKYIHGLFQADLIDARTLWQGPIGDTGWKFAVAGRRSYVDVWLKPALEQLDAGVTTAPVYYDYQAMVSRDWDHGKQNFRFFFFGSDDRLSILIKDVNAANPGLGGNITFGTAFYRFQARYTAKFSEDTELRVVGAFGKDAVDFSLGDNYFTLTSWPINLRTEISQKLQSSVRNNFGLDVQYTPYTVDLRLPPQPTPGQPPAGPFGGQPPLEVSDTDAIYRPALYDELELTPFRGTRLIPGVRLDYAKDTKAWDIQPRFVARQEVVHEFPRTTLKGGIGRFAQPPQPQETNPVFGLPGTKSNVANHYGLGVEQELTKQIELGTEGFYRQYDQLVVSNLGNVGGGRAFGLETLLRYKPDERFFGFLAYTLSRSTRIQPGQPEHLFTFDQTHILTAVGSYRLGRGWEIGARFRLVSGNLTTPQTYGFYDLNVGSYLALASYPQNNTRNPMFHQLDLRVDKKWVFTGGSSFSAYLDIYNVYNQGNIEGVSYNYNYTLSTKATGVPFLPSIGVRAEL